MAQVGDQHIATFQVVASGWLDSSFSSEKAAKVLEYQLLQFKANL